MKFPDQPTRSGTTGLDAIERQCHVDDDAAGLVSSASRQATSTGRAGATRPSEFEIALTPIDGPDGSLARRPTRYDMCLTTGKIARPIRVHAHERQDCITDRDALNLVDPEVGWPADWHDFCWRSTDTPPRFAAHSTDETYRVVSSVLGGDRTFDCRSSLRRLALPESMRPTPAWCAHHDRAILEAAWSTWQAGQYSAPWPLAPSVVDDWIWTPAQMDSLKELAERVEPHLPQEARAGWRKWRLEQLQYAIGRS